jgi:NitT/TauT family transport system permease protein
MIRYFSTRHYISKKTTTLLGVLSVTSLIALYLCFAHYRHQINPRDQLTPTISQMLKALKVASSPDEFTSIVPLWADIKSSLRLLGFGFGLAVVVSLFIGLHAGAWPWFNALIDPLMKVFSYIPTITLLFIIFITLGYEDKAKIFIIFIATVVPLIRSLTLRVQGVSDKQIWKAETLGASRLEVIWIVLRKVTEPGFLDDIRLQLGNAWVYLIVAELIASEQGLGYRINLSSRNMNVSMILVYLIVITTLAFLMDRLIWAVNMWRNRWAYSQ